MKILFLTGCINQIGGIERVALDVIKILKSAKHEISIISYSKASGDGFPELSNLDVAYLNKKPISIRYSFLKAGKLRKTVNEINPDFIVYVDSFLYLFFRSFIPKKYKQIVWEHFNYTTTFGTRSRTWARKYAAATADACVLLSEADAAMWRKNCWCRAEIKVIPNPVRGDVLAASRERERIVY